MAECVAVGRTQRRSFWARHDRAIQAVSILALAWGAAYLTWRIIATATGANPVTFLVLLAAEIFGWVSLAGYTFMAWRVPPSVRPPLRRRPAVDVYVCTYDEPVAVLEATLAGCRSITYPHTTWLLDDGRRAEMAALASEWGARYLTRPDNAHAKAGNINHALRCTSGELVLMLDADHVPLPDILDATLGYFDDPDLALVQTPHDFFNRDSVQHTRLDRHEQTLFYEVIAPGKDRHGAAFWCGSATVVRRAALLAVGGVLTDTVAEDFHTTIAMHARGMHTKYHHETVVQGLAPHDLDSFLLQRDRWARGNLRVFRTKENPLWCRGLTPRQRISYFLSLLSYFSGLQRLAMLSVLAATLLTGKLPLTASATGLLLAWLPWTALSLTATIALARGTLGPADSTRYGLMTMGIFCRAAISSWFGGTGRFKVTPKEGIDPGGFHVLRSLALLTTVGVVLLLAESSQLLAASGVAPLPRLHGAALVITLVLGVYELGFITGVLLPLVRRHQLRAHYRFPAELSGTVAAAVVRVLDLSPEGFGVEVPFARGPGDQLTLVVRLPSTDGTALELALPAEVRSAAPGAGPGSWRLGCRVTGLDARSHDRLVEYCYVFQPSRLLRTGPQPRTRPAPAQPGALAS